MLSKIVYFDEASVTDFMQIVAGGQLEKTTELLKQSMKDEKSLFHLCFFCGFFFVHTPNSYTTLM